MTGWLDGWNESRDTFLHRGLHPFTKMMAVVVVGSHGRSGLRAAILGSISRHVVDHAHCPVVVVRPRS